MTSLPHMFCEVPCGSTLAYSYAEGYLKLLLPKLDTHVLDEFSSKHQISKVYPKMLVLIPNNCNPPTNFVLYDSHNIHHVGKIRFNINVSGTIQRPYDVDVFKITHNGSSVYAMVSIPANIITIHKMMMDANVACSESDMRLAREKFSTALKTLISVYDINRSEVLSISGMLPNTTLSKMLYLHIMDK